MAAALFLHYSYLYSVSCIAAGLLRIAEQFVSKEEYPKAVQISIMYSKQYTNQRGNQQYIEKKRDVKIIIRIPIRMDFSSSSSSSSIFFPVVSGSFDDFHIGSLQFTTIDGTLSIYSDCVKVKEIETGTTREQQIERNRYSKGE